MTGYQETLTDPSYHQQLVTFTYPHIGNVGTNSNDGENLLANTNGANGFVCRNLPTSASNYRQELSLATWATNRGIVGICGVDTRALVRHIKATGPQLAIIDYLPAGAKFDLESAQRRLQDSADLFGADMALAVTQATESVTEANFSLADNSYRHNTERQARVVVINFGIKRALANQLTALGCQLVILPLTLAMMR